MYLFTEYVFRESVDSAHNSQISSTFQEADCLLKLVKINISARAEIITLSVGLGGGGETEKTLQLITYKRMGTVNI